MDGFLFFYATTPPPSRQVNHGQYKEHESWSVAVFSLDTAASGNRQHLSFILVHNDRQEISPPQQQQQRQQRLQVVNLLPLSQKEVTLRRRPTHLLRCRPTTTNNIGRPPSHLPLRTTLLLPNQRRMQRPPHPPVTPLLLQRRPPLALSRRHPPRRLAELARGRWDAHALGRCGLCCGVRYVEVALFTIPRHGYFETEEYREERRRSVVEARRVVHLLGGWVREERQGDDGGEEKVEEGREDTRSKRETIHKLAVAAQQSYDQIMMEPEKPNGHSFRSVEAQCSSWKEYVLDGADNLCSLLTVLDCGSLGTVHGKDEGVDHPANVHVDAEKDGKGQLSLRFEEDPKSYLCKVVEEEPTLTSSRDESEIIRSQHENLGLGNAASNATNSSAASQDISQRNSGLSMKRSFSNHSRSQRSVEELEMVESCGSIMTEKFVPDVTVDAATSNRTVEVLAAGGGQPMRQDSDGFDRGEIAMALSLSRRDCDMATTENTQYQCTKPLHYSNNISAQTKLYAQKFHSLVESEKVHVRFLDTYQGRIPGSTNGCTVIASLTCIQYFITPESNTHWSHAWNHGLPDEHIHQVIDVHAPTILSNVRSKLNLAPDSFIIPSDVHDHLLQVGLLSPTSFVGVIGGNILDDHHLMQLKNALLLSDDDNERMRLKGRKIASALFFHGHVVALHVIHSPGDERVFVELIDSLPIPEAWVSPRGRHSSSNSCDSSVVRSENRQVILVMQTKVRMASVTSGKDTSGLTSKLPMMNYP
eukprot:CCRYP_013937-RA/>CCRYP_013937-RA protein AED:0.13 eAED:0.13 QI:0/1/0.5/1/0/0/2/311/758